MRGSQLYWKIVVEDPQTTSSQLLSIWYRLRPPAASWIKEAILQHPNCPIEIYNKGGLYPKEEALCIHTKPERLLKIYEERPDFEELGKLVIRNPNCPVDLLLEGAARHPGSFLDNPSLPLLLCEDPLLFTRLSREALWIFKCEGRRDGRILELLKQEYDRRYSPKPAKEAAV